MESKEIFNELTHVSDSYDGEYISFDKDVLLSYLDKFCLKLQNTTSNSKYMVALEDIIKEGVENNYVVYEIVLAVQRLNQQS